MIRLEFYGIQIDVSGPEEIIEKLRKDFSYFYIDQARIVEFSVVLAREQPDYSLVENKPAVLRHREFTMYDGGNKKYIDYKGKGLSEYDRTNSRIKMVSLDNDLLHEIGYLAVLSVAGEMLEQKSLYRVHGLGLNYNGRGVIITAPTGSGKTTFLMELIGNKNMFFFSDDIVLMDKNLKMMPFPVRIGLKEEERERFDNIPDKYVYELHRRKYGKKVLLDVRWFREKIAEPVIPDMLIIGKRWAFNYAKIKKINKMRMFAALFGNLVVGIGLPQVIEYLDLEVSFSNMVKLAKKAFCRMRIALRLLMKSRAYIMYIGMNSANNVQLLIQFLGNKK
ncbi:MAG: hypothetical protein ABIH89_05045 [Elusimicrobiota bacterium]